MLVQISRTPFPVQFPSDRQLAEMKSYNNNKDISFDTQSSLTQLDGKVQWTKSVSRGDGPDMTVCIAMGRRENPPDDHLRHR